MRPGERGAARRYARALFDVAVQQGDPEVVRRELREAAALLAAQAELRSALLSPALPGEARKKLVKCTIRCSGLIFRSSLSACSASSNRPRAMKLLITFVLAAVLFGRKRTASSDSFNASSIRPTAR